MADHPLFPISVVTPEGPAFEGEAEMLIVPGAAGEIGVLARHAPLVAMLKAGSTRVPWATARCASSRPAPASSRCWRTGRSRWSTTRSRPGHRRGAGAPAARGGAGRARQGRCGRLDRRPLAARAAHPPRREPADGQRRELGSTPRAAAPRSADVPAGTTRPTRTPASSRRSPPPRSRRNAPRLRHRVAHSRA